MGDHSKREAGEEAEDRNPPANDGVDVTLIRWMLSLTPGQRLRVLQRNVESILRLRHARSGT
jgi:hypothetical protein